MDSNLTIHGAETADSTGNAPGGANATPGGTEAASGGASSGGAGFTLTQSAVDRVAVLLAGDETQDPVFRVAVLGGGCSGFKYSFAIEGGDALADDDHILALTASSGADIRVAVDSMSLGMLAGSELDFKRELIGSYFSVTNPNATASCGCGTSFAL